MQKKPDEILIPSGLHIDLAFTYSGSIPALNFALKKAPAFMPMPLYAPSSASELSRNR